MYVWFKNKEKDLRVIMEIMHCTPQRIAHDDMLTDGFMARSFHILHFIAISTTAHTAVCSIGLVTKITR